MYRNSDMKAAIDEYVHVTWQREACRLKFCEGYTYEQIAEKLGYSTQHIKATVKRHKETLFSILS